MIGRLVGAWESSSLDVFTATHPTTPRTITLTASQTYYPSGDATATDLVDVIHDLIRAAGGEMADITVSISAAGIVTIANAHASNSLVITWGTATALRDFLRFPSTATLTVAAQSSQSGSRCVEGSFYPSRSVIADLMPEDSRGSRTVGDGGQVETHHYATLTQAVLELRVQGTPREATYGEWYAARDAWRRAVQGIPLRWYPSTSVTAAYADQSAPYGYREWTLRSPTRWNPAPIQAQYYGWFSLPLDLDLYVP